MERLPIAHPRAFTRMPDQYRNRGTAPADATHHVRVRRKLCQNYNPSSTAYLGPLNRVLEIHAENTPVKGQRGKQKTKTSVRSVASY
jgi:hypothetical protein